MLVSSARPAVTVARTHARVARLALALLALAACSDAPTGPPTGSLVIPPITGLPVGATPVVTVNHVDSPMEGILLQAGDTLDALRAGAYVVTAEDVVAGGLRWSGVPATQTMNVGDGYRVTAQPIVYELASGALRVQLLGLPAGVAPAITLTGPRNAARVVTASQVLSPLDAGTWTVAANIVEAGGRTYRPDATTRTLAVTGGDTTPVTIDYGSGSATLAVALDGIPAGTDARVTVTGPAGYMRMLDASSTLQHLEPGSYTIAAATVAGSLATHAPSPATQTVTLAAGASAGASVLYGSAGLGLRQELVAEGLQSPVFLTAPAGDARLFVVERRGRIRVVKGGALLPTPFLDITSRVNFTGERGLLGMAFDPAYATSGRFYVYYVDAASDLRLEAFESTPGSDVASGAGSLVLRIAHGGSEHHGGNLAFGPDGMLYLAPGDGGCCGDPRDNAQNTATLLGKLLRIDVHSAPYAVPADNPFVGRAGVQPAIWGLGLRSPWRFSFDAPTGRLYLGDVGQDAREEVSVVPATRGGHNFGWPIMEGRSCYRPASGCATAGLTLPVLEYTHTEGCSVTGGYVYRGAAIPELAGHYLYADFCRGWIRSARVTGRGTALAAGEQRTWPELQVPFIVSFGRDGFGELYMVANGGRIWRLAKR
jgi:glucose/arabinose dehydrogenase